MSVLLMYLRNIQKKNESKVGLVATYIYICTYGLGQILSIPIADHKLTGDCPPLIGVGEVFGGSEVIRPILGFYRHLKKRKVYVYINDRIEQPSYVLDKIKAFFFLCFFIGLFI